MKNLIIVALSIFTISFGFSQEKTADFGSNTVKFQENRSNGFYIFHVNANEFTKENIEKAAGYYKDHFNVTSKKEGESLQVQIVLKGINQQNRNIVTRFFVSLGVKEVSYKNETFDVMDFTKKYI